MKRRSNRLREILSILLIPCIWMLSLNLSDAQIDFKKVEAKLIKYKFEFEALVKEDRVRYSKLLNEADQHFKGDRKFTALVYLDDANSIFSNNYLTLNTRGTIYGSMGLNKEGIDAFSKALVYNPYDIQVNLNLIDLQFKERNYDQVVKLTNRLNFMIMQQAKLKSIPSLPYRDFKALLAISRLADSQPKVWDEKIKILESKYTYKDDHPYYYFSNALTYLKEGKKEEALMSIISAYHVFNNPRTIGLWVDTLIESQYLSAIDWQMHKKENLRAEE